MGVEEGRRRREGQEGRHLQARGEVRRRVQAAGERRHPTAARGQEGELDLRSSGGEAGLCYSHQRYYWYVAEGEEDPPVTETEAAPLRRLRQVEWFHDQDAAARRTVHRLWYAQLKNGQRTRLQARLRQGQQAARAHRQQRRGRAGPGQVRHRLRRGRDPRAVHDGAPLQGGRELPLALQAVQPDGRLQDEAPPLQRGRRRGRPRGEDPRAREEDDLGWGMAVYLSRVNLKK